MNEETKKLGRQEKWPRIAWRCPNASSNKTRNQSSGYLLLFGARDSPLLASLPPVKCRSSLSDLGWMRPQDDALAGKKSILGLPRTEVGERQRGRAASDTGLPELIH
jgi:hypothetical protein